MLNKVMLIGHLGGNPEIRRTNDGRPVATFSLATSERWRDKDSGERKERTEWHRVTVWTEGLCKVVEQYLKKGSKVYLEGAMQTRKWTDQAGVEKYTTEVVLKAFGGTLVMLDTQRNGPPPAGSENDYGTGDTREPASASRRPAMAGGDGKPSFDDEIPF